MIPGLVFAIPVAFGLACMNSRSWHNRTIGCIAALGACVGSVVSQGLIHPSTAIVVRQQFGSIADEVVGKLPLAARSPITLLVQAQMGRSIAENAFVEVLQQKGYQTLLREARDSSAAILNIEVLTDRAEFKDIGQHAFARTVETELEARTEQGNGANAMVLGIFRRVSQDTVSEKDAQTLMVHPADDSDEEATFFQRLVGPLIVLASGIMIVYLFFTVRS